MPGVVPAWLTHPNHAGLVPSFLLKGTRNDTRLVTVLPIVTKASRAHHKPENA